MSATKYDVIEANSVISPGLSNSTGKVWYVSNSSTLAPNGIKGSNGNDGISPESPFASIDYAVGRCTANRGDIIRVMPGHIEDVTAIGGLDLDIAGITLEFMGEGSNRAAIRFGTVVGADMDVDAANITLIGARFVNNLDNLTAPIDVNSANFKMLNVEFVDAAAKNTIRWVLADANADGLEIDGVKFDKANEAGTQKVALIDVQGATNVRLSNIDAIGNFSSGVIVNSTAWIDAILKNCLIENTNATPNPALVLQATSTGHVVDSKLTIASGTTYHTANNDMQFFNSFGSNADAGGTEELGSIISGSVEGKVVNVIDALYDGGIATFPAAIDPGNGATLAGVVRRNHVLATQIDQNLTGVAGIVTWDAGAAAGNGVSISESLRFAQEGIRQSGGTAMAANKGVADALGTNGTTVTDSAVSVLGAIGANNNNNAFDSTNVVANRDGSLLERTEYIINQGGAEGGTQYSGTTDAGMIASTTAIVSADLAGYGDDFFNTKYYMQIIKNANSVGNAPEREVRQITDYGSATGTFTTDAFTVNVEASDNILILHEAYVLLGRDDNNNTFASTNVASNADGSVLERQEWTQAQIGTLLNTGGTASLGGILGDANNISVAVRLGNLQTDIGDPSARTNFQSLETMIGMPDAANSNLDDIVRTGFDSTALAANEDGSIIERLEQLQEVVNKGAGTAIAANKSLVDALGSDGNAVTDSAVSVLGAIGANNNNNAFDSTNVAANVDGSVFERLEHLKNIVTVLPNDSITAAGIANGAIDAATFAAGAIDAAAIANSAIDAATFAAGAIDAAAIADSSIDRTTFAVDTGLRSIESATAQAGAAGTITLVATASATADFYNGTIILITGGTGVGQSRLIVDYDGATKIATVEPNWATAPDVTSTYAISPATESLSAIGADNGNNAYSSVAVVANVDGSVLERLEDLVVKVTAVDDLVDTEVAAIQTDIGNPSARANFQSLETMIGVPDAANSNVDDMLRTGFDSTAIASNRDGSIMERDEWNKDQFGTLVNTGGTASLGGIIGDVANTSVASRLTTIEADTNTIEGVSLAAAPTAGSLSRFVATGGTALGTQLPNSKSLYDMVRSYGRGYLISKAYADLTGYDTANAFTVTGDVEVQIIGVVGAVAITSTSGTTTLSIGTTEAPQAIIANTTIDNAQFAATDVWVDTSPSVDCEIMPSAAWNIVGGSANIALTRSADDITAGTLTLYCWWRPLSANGNVVPA